MKIIISLSFLLLSFFSISDEIFETVEIYFPNGQLGEKGEMLEGMQHGYWEFFYNNGNLKESSNWLYGLEEGLAESFYRNGNPKLTGNFSQGNQTGLWKAYFESGEINKTALALNISVLVI